MKLKATTPDEAKTEALSRVRDYLRECLGEVEGALLNSGQVAVKETSCTYCDGSAHEYLTMRLGDIERALDLGRIDQAKSALRAAQNALAMKPPSILDRYRSGEITHSKAAELIGCTVSELRRIEAGPLGFEPECGCCGGTDHHTLTCEYFNAGPGRCDKPGCGWPDLCGECEVPPGYELDSHSEGGFWWWHWTHLRDERGYLSDSYRSREGAIAAAWKHKRGAS